MNTYNHFLQKIHLPTATPLMKLFAKLGALFLSLVLFLIVAKPLQEQSLDWSAFLNEHFVHGAGSVIPTNSDLPRVVEKLATSLYTSAKENQNGKLPSVAQTALIASLNEELMVGSTTLTSPNVPLVKKWQASLQLEGVLQVYVGNNIFPSIVERYIETKLSYVNALQVELTNQVAQTTASPEALISTQDEMINHILDTRKQFVAAVDAGKLNQNEIEQIESYLTMAEQDELVVGVALRKNDAWTMSKFLIDSEYQIRRAQLALVLVLQ